MGNRPVRRPKEAHMGDRLRCNTCNEVQRPAWNFSDVTKRMIDNKPMYVFNGGEYYRQIDHNQYFCNDCFYKKIWLREEKKRQQEQKQRREKLSKRLQQSRKQAEQQQEQQQTTRKSVEFEQKQSVLKQTLNEFSPDEPDEFSGDLLEVLSSLCDFPVTSLSLTHLTYEQLRQVISAMDTLLFEKWINTRPPLKVLHHAQVFLTQMCTLTLDTSEGISLESISKQMQSLVHSISRSADNILENFLLTQGLYLSLVHLFTDYDDDDSDAVHIAKQWAEGDLSAETAFVLSFLSILIESLQKVVGMASVFVLKMEINCLKLLFSILTHLNGQETHNKVTEMNISLVQTNGWNPVEALSLLKLLSERYKNDASIIKILTLLQVYNVSPMWKDNCERSLIESIDFSGPENFYKTFEETLKNQDLDNCDASEGAVECWDVDEAVLKRVLTITNNTSNTLKDAHDGPTDVPVLRRHYKIETFDDGQIQEMLTQLCKAVFHSKGWWPSRSQMIDWCAAVLAETSQPPKLVGFDEDPCVTAMIAAMHVSMGNKLDIVLSSGALSVQETKEWTDFYKNLGISVKTNRRKANESHSGVYEADIVYGSLEDFVTDYFEYGLETMEAGQPQLNRGFLIEKGCLSAGHNLKFSRLKNNEALGFVAEELQSLMGKMANEEIELRRIFFGEIFKVLHSDPKDHVDTNLMNLSQTLAGQKLPSRDVFVIVFLETLTKAVAKEAKVKNRSNSPLVKWCFESLLACAMKFQASKAKELLLSVSNLVSQEIWAAKEIFKLLGALTSRHMDENYISIMKILHLMTTYQISSQWKDENNQSLLQLAASLGSQDLIQHLGKSGKAEKDKSLDILFDEIRALKDLDEETLEKSYTIIKYVQGLIKTGEIKDHADAGRARSLSHSMKTEDMQEVLAVLCNGIHHTIANGWWWPRGTQMASWCFLTMANNGKLLQMGTGEGKSVVVAMFAALRALRGEKVDVISSSPVLCQRDAEECAGFYSYFGLTVDTNTNKTRDIDRKKCYEKDVIYGTVETYAADHLRQTFEMKDVRPNRRYECIVIDEVDLLLLDQGIQVTYLSSSMSALQHLNIILTMIWGHVSQYCILPTGYQTLIGGPPASFYKAIYDSMHTEGTDIDDAMDILEIAEECNIVPKGFTEEIYKSDKDTIVTKLKCVSVEAQLNFFNEIEKYVPYGFTVYTFDGKSLILRKQSLNKEVIQNVKFLIVDNGMCHPLYDSEAILIGPIAELIRSKLDFTPCENNSNKINIPGFLKDLVEHKAATWVENAFLAMRLKKGREYVVQDGRIYPVDFKSTGTVELNKKWGEGLQQFVEIKHQIKIGTMTSVTNYVSNIAFFEKYNGKLYGLTGTLGSRSDMMFINNQYPSLSACAMPSFKGKKLFEVKGILKNSTAEWKSEIKRVLMDEITSNSYREGRAALVICETINRVNELHEELKGTIPGEIITYTQSNAESLKKIRKKLNPGDVVLATNLAGRGTNIKVIKDVNKNGGLFVILSFLSDNERVERQAFGRTARKGNPGSAQIIMSTDHLDVSYGTADSMEDAKKMRDSLAIEKIQDMQGDIDQMKLREDLFSEYCETLRVIYNTTEEDEQKAIVSVMNEFWGVWLQTRSEDIEQLKRSELQKSLRADLAFAKKQAENHNSPSSSVYQYIQFGNIALEDKKWNDGAKLFQKATKQDASWAAIAFYNRAYCIIKMRPGNYLNQAKDEMKKAQDSLKYFSEECLTGLNFIKMSLPKTAKDTTLEKQYSTKCNMLTFLDKNMNDAIKKLEDIIGKGRDALAKKAPVFTLVAENEEELQMETFNLYDRGLKYVFSVEEEPYFPWGALAVFFLGLLQIIAGALLTAFTFGACAQVGMGLICEGVSDCISGVESMITGEFSWQSWAIDKAISIGISLIGFGIGKLVAKGVKVFKAAAKAFGKMKQVPKFFASQAKEGFSATMKANMKNAVKLSAKKIAEETIAYGIERAENEIINKILEEIEKAVCNGILNKVKSNMERDPLRALTNSIVLSHVTNKKEFNEILKDKVMQGHLQAIFKELGTTALEPYSADLGWQNQLSSSIINVVDAVKEDAGGKTKMILIAIQATHMTVLAADAVASVVTLSGKYFTGLAEGLEDFKRTKGYQQTLKESDLSGSEHNMLNDFRGKVTQVLGSLLAKTLVEVFHQKFSGHLVSMAQSKVNDAFGEYVSSGLKTEDTEKMISAAQDNLHDTHMPKDPNAHADKVKNSETSGSTVDINVLSEATGTKVVILTEGKDGKLSKMNEMSPQKEDAAQTVTLVYRPKSEKYPDGHYDVVIDGKTVTVEKGDVYHAMAQGMNPGASEKELKDAADELRDKEAEALAGDPSLWQTFIQRDEWIEELIVGSWGLAEGVSSAQKVTIKEKILSIVKQESETSLLDKPWILTGKDIEITGGLIINGDNQPPRNTVLIADHIDSGSSLTDLMFAVASDLSSHAKCKLPVVYAPYERYNKFPTAQSPKLSQLLAQTMSRDDVEGTFKLTIIGAMPTFMLQRNQLQKEEMSVTRLDSFEHSFPEHATEMVNEWFKLLERKSNLIKPDEKQALLHWINTKRYLDPNDPHRKLLTGSK